MAKVRLEIEGKDNGASAAVKGVTGSLIKAQLAVEGIKLAWRGMVAGFRKIQESIDLASDFEETTSKFETVFKDVADESKAMANNLQKNYGLSSLAAKQLLSDTGDMLTGFGFAGDSALELSNSVQELAVDLASFTNFSGGAKGASEALTKGLLGEREMMKSLGIAINESDLQAELASQGKDKLTGMALRQAKAEATLTLAIKQSKNAIGDYAKTSDSYANVGRRIEMVQQDIQIAIAQQLLPAFNEVRLEILKSAESFKEYVSSAETIEKLGGITRNLMASFSVLKEVVKDLAEKGLVIIKDIAEDVKESWNNLMGSFEDGNKEFSLLDTVVRALGTALAITGKVVKTTIVGFIDLITVAKESAQVLGDVWQVIRGKKTWEDVKNSIKDVGSALENLASNATGNIGEIVTTTIDEFDKLTDSTQSQSKKWKDIYEQSYKEILDRQKAAKKEMDDNPLDPTDEDAEEKLRSWADSFKDASTMAKDTYTNTENYISNATGSMFNSVKDGFAAIGEAMADETKTGAEKAIAVMQGLLDTTSGILSSIQEMYNSYYQEQLAIQQENEEARLESVDEWAEREMESQGVRIATKQEQLQEEIDTLNDKLATETDAEQRAALEKELNDKQSELKRTQILDEAEKKKEAIQKKAKEKETALKKKQFEENKAFSIAQIWINAASSVLGWWAAFATMGIPGIVLAGVMTAATLAIAGVQTGLVASQTFHGEEGGVIPTGTATGDRAVTYMNKGEALIRNDDYNALVTMARGGGGMSKSYQIATINMYGVNNPTQFAEQLNDLQRYEKNR